MSAPRLRETDVLDLIWRTSAADQLDAIFDFISLQDPVAAERIVQLIHDGAERLRWFPESGRIGRVAGTRELIVHPNYVLIYQVIDDRIRMIRVLHARQRYP